MGPIDNLSEVVKAIKPTAIIGEKNGRLFMRRDVQFQELKSFFIF